MKIHPRKNLYMNIPSNITHLSELENNHFAIPNEINQSETFFFFNFYLFIYLFIYLWLCWVFVSVRGLSLVAASGGHSSSRCAGLSLSRPLLLWSTGTRRTGSVIMAHGPSCSVACGIFPDQGLNPCPLPALAGRFSTTAPPGKPSQRLLMLKPLGKRLIGD